MLLLLQRCVLPAGFPLNQLFGEFLAGCVNLKLHSELVRSNKNCYTAEMLYDLFKDERNGMYITYLKSILTAVQLALKAYTGERNNPAKLLNSLVSLLQSVCSRVTRPTVCYDMLNTPVADYVNNAA